MRYENVTFTRKPVQLDHNEFVDCHFDHCQLIFTAVSEIAFNRCTFVGTKWRFEGAAIRTIKALCGIASMGDGGRAEVEEIFEAIRETGEQLRGLSGPSLSDQPANQPMIIVTGEKPTLN